MAKNKFDVKFAALTQNGLVMSHTVIPNISITKLPFLGKVLSLGKIFLLRKKFYMVVYGDMDLSGIITRTSRNFNVSYFSKMIVVGDFHCSKYSKVFPAVVSGCFDCSKMEKGWIDKDVSLPSAQTINCAHCISGFDELMGVLPDDVEFLIVDPGLIKKDFIEEHTDEIVSFLHKYPNVTVMDTRGVRLKDVIKKVIKDYKDEKKAIEEDKKLRELAAAIIRKIGDKLKELADKYPEKENEILYYYMKEIHEPLMAQNGRLKDFTDKLENVISKPEKFFKKLEEMVKTEGKHLDAQDIFALFRQEDDFKDLSDDELIRLVRHVLSDQRKNGLKKQVLYRAKDEQNVVCAFTAQLPLIRADLKKLIAENKEKRQGVKPEKTPTAKPVAVAPKKTQSEVQPTVNIKKYITKAQYKALKRSSQHNAISVLQDINDINLNPLDMQKQGPVQIIKYGQKTFTKNAKKEFGSCIVQSIDGAPSEDKKRLVWTVADGPTGVILVCLAFVKDHGAPGTRKRREYNELLQIAEEKHTYTAKDLVEYQDVEEILKSDGGKPDAGSGFSIDDILNQEINGMKR